MTLYQWFARRLVSALATGMQLQRLKVSVQIAAAALRTWLLRMELISKRGRLLKHCAFCVTLAHYGSIHTLATLGSLAPSGCL